ncbi:MAG: transporter substrate-binding domain-containing protein [Gammaproteobacteria bacterium]|nr:transporter substrate-binding domain-containing protein [Gammaproteobacteria bacterium]
MLIIVRTVLALIMLISFPLLTFGEPLSDSENDFLKNKQTIQMCVDPDWMPLEKVERGKHIGIAADFMTLFEKHLGIPIELVPSKNWVESIQFAKSRRCDIFSMVMTTPERLEYMGFTQPYLSVPLVMATDNNKPFVADISELRDKNMGVVEGYAIGDLLRAKYPHMQMVDVKSVNHGLQLVEEGELYGFIGALVTVGHAIQKGFTNELKITGKFDSKWELGVGVRNDEPLLLSAFKKAIDSVSHQQNQEIINRWLSVRLESGFDYSLFWKIIALILLLMSAFLYHYFKIRRYQVHLEKLIEEKSHDLRAAKDAAEEANRAKGELRDSEAQLRTLFETLTTGLALCRIDGSLVKVNEAYASILGRTIEETINLTYWDITPKKYADNEKEQLELLNTTGQYGPYIKEYIHKDGHLVPVQLMGSLIEQGDETYIWSVVEDITERRNSEEALRRSQKMEAIGQLTGGIAHDFNNILGVILGNLDLLERQLKPDEKSRKRVESMKKAGQRAVNLTKQLLNFSSRQAAQLAITDINRVIVGMDSLITRSITPEVEVEYLFDDNLWLSQIDPGDFEDALLNLVINARDAMAGQGHLRIETHNATLDVAYCKQNPGVSPGEYVELVVSDIGEGISHEEQEQIFEPFYTTKEQGKGTGLGLAMVFGFVQRSGGSIKCYSEVGVGTTFHLFLPRAEGEELPDGQTSVQTETIPRGTETILVVDDEESLAELAKEFLEALGYQVHTAHDGRQALECLAKESEIDLLFSDVVMPGGISGYELAKEDNASHPKLKILLTSGFTGKAVSPNGQLQFSENLLSKPYSQIELATRVRAMLDGVESAS